MKFSNNPLLAASLAACMIISASLAPRAGAVTRYWSGVGTWDTSIAKWATTSGGTYNTAWPNATADIAIFEGTAANVTIGSNLNAANLTFNTTGYNLIADSPTKILTGPSAIQVNLAANVSASIGSNITFTTSGSTTSFNLNGPDKSTNILDLSGTIKNTTANNNGINGITANINSGGLVQSANSMFLGSKSDGTGGLGAILNLAGGNYEITSTTGNLIMNGTAGITASSAINITSGNLTFTNTANTGGIRFGSGSTNILTQLTGTINLDGGTATIGKIFMGGSYTGGAVYNAVVNLNGGTLKALRNETAFLGGLTSGTSGAFVKAGGAIFDTNSFNITVGQALLADSPSGGLKKDGVGTLTLSGSSTYTGDTLVNNGTLALSSTGGLKFKIGATGVNNQISGTGAGTVSLDGLFTFDLTSASTTLNDSWNIVDAANLIESYGDNFKVGGSFAKTGGGTGPGLWTQPIGLTSNFYAFDTSTGLLSVVPEPSTTLLGTLGLLALLRRKRA